MEADIIFYVSLEIASKKMTGNRVKYLPPPPEQKAEFNTVLPNLLQEAFNTPEQLKMSPLPIMTQMARKVKSQISSSVLKLQEITHLRRRIPRKNRPGSLREPFS